MKKYLIIFAALALGGCKKYLDVNVNPNSATKTNSSYVFTNALARTVSGQVGGVHVMAGSWVGFYGHSTSFTGGGQEKTYVFTNNDFNFFDGLYDNIADYTYVIKHGADDGVGFLVGPAKVMRAYVMQKIVDLYGNSPYSQAMQLITDPAAASLTPSYDNAQTIYEDLMTKLTEAIADIKSATWPATYLPDIAFKGVKTNWIKMANTLKLRILMRQSNMTGRAAYITPKISEIISEGSGFITSDVTIQPGYSKAVGSSGSKENPFYLNYGYDNNDAITSYSYRKPGAVIINYLKSTNDLFRLSRIATVNGYDPSAASNLDPTVLANYTGIPLGGSGTPYLSSATANIGSMVIVKGDAARPVVLMAYSEALFLQAEAANRYALLGTDATLYAAAVQAAFRQVAPQYAAAPTATVAAADAAAATYLAGPGVYGGAGAAGLTTIWRQKYVALMNIDGLEAWSEYRRTNALPANTGSAPTNPQSVATTSAQPVRLFYPLREQNVNSGNYVGVNVFTDRIFWDVN